MPVIKAVLLTIIEEILLAKYHKTNGFVLAGKNFRKEVVSLLIIENL
jgi:hypothetical protein